MAGLQRAGGSVDVRVLGVDPGLTRLGLGVVDGVPGGRLTLVAVDVLRTPAGDDIGTRLIALERGLVTWIERYQPEVVAVERVFSQHNVRTVMGTAQAGAVAIVCAARFGIPVVLHTPSEVKAAVSGNGRATRRRSLSWSPGCCGWNRHPSRPTPPTRWRWPSVTSG